MFRFWVYRARREGKPLPRWQLEHVSWTEGRLRVDEEKDDWLGRVVRVARLTSERGGAEFPALLEPQLLQADDARLVINGVERDESTRCDRMQTWVLHNAAHKGDHVRTYFAYRARREGAPIPRWQLHAVSWSAGRMTLGEERDAWLGRTIRVARLNSDRGNEVFPALLEAQLIYADDDRIILNGLERDELTKRDCGQTWVLHSKDRNGTVPRKEPTRPAAQAERPEMLPP